jgi:hypothetical protein
MLSASVILTGQEKRQIDPVYMKAGGMIYHTKDCDSVAGQRDVLSFPRASIPSRAVACSICKPDVPVIVPDPSTDFSLFIDHPTRVYAEQDAASEVRRTLQPFDVAMVLRAESGWIRVDVGGGVRGWIGSADLDRQNMLNENRSIALARINFVKLGPWDAATKLEMARRRAHPGYTTDQLRLTLGDPKTIQSEETAAGVTENWSGNGAPAYPAAASQNAAAVAAPAKASASGSVP